MSSEYSIHLSNRPLEARVVPLGESYGNTITLNSEATEHTNRERFTLFVKDDRLLEMSLLFHKIAQDLAALLPDVSPLPRTEEGQVALPPTAAEMGWPDAIPIDDVREAVEPPHRWG